MLNNNYKNVYDAKEQDIKFKLGGIMIKVGFNNVFIEYSELKKAFDKLPIKEKESYSNIARGEI